MNGVIITSVLAISSAVVFTQVQQLPPTNEWYPPGCCGASDCEIISKDRVKLKSSGWEVFNAGEWFKVDPKLLRDSPTGEYVICDTDKTTPYVACFAIPPQAGT